ncbi:MAG: hypothetical protein RLZZ571_296 [Actinomycetota bacterium]|jgi:hypothetical protein
MEYPAAIELAIWLNQYRVGAISMTDAINAAETISNVTEVHNASEPVSWSKLIRNMPFSAVPYYAILPTPGNTFGLDAKVHQSFDLAEGVCVLSQNVVLGQVYAQNPSWKITRIEKPLIVPDPRIARAQLNALIETAAAQLSAIDVTGDREDVDQSLHQLKPIHLPPALPNRAKVDLELAQRIWLIAQFGISDSQVHASPSSDDVRVQTLQQLRTAALELMAASTAVA